MRLGSMFLPCLLAILFGLTATAAAQEFIGVVKSIEGSAVIQRNQETISVTIGMDLQEGDVVSTEGNEEG